MSFQREEYVASCWRRARVFRLLAAAVAGVGAVIFGVVWWVERVSGRVVMNTDPVAAALASATLLVVCLILLLSYRLPGESDGG